MTYGFRVPQTWTRGVARAARFFVERVMRTGVADVHASHEVLMQFAAARQAENAKLQEMLMDLRAREAMLKAELMEARDTMNTTIAAAPAAAEEGGAKKLMGKMKMGFGKK